MCEKKLFKYLIFNYNSCNLKFFIYTNTTHTQSLSSFLFCRREDEMNVQMGRLFIILNAIFK